MDSVTDADASDPVVYWQANARDARGNLVEVALGNGNTTIRDYNAATGYLGSVLTGTTLGTEAQSLSFAWDKVGNLISRTDENQNGLIEDFQYDNLNRMVQATITQGPSYIEPLYVDYDEIGNIVYKSDVGEYNYNTRPHAVSEVIDGPRNATYSYDANGNMTSGADRAIQWTAFNKPRAIVRDSNPPSGTFYNGGTLYASNASAFFYGPDRSRYKQLRNQQTDDGFIQSTIVYVGGIYEHHDNATKPDEDRAYIQAGGQTIAIRIERDNNDNDTEYLHRDHLGSVTAMTDSSGDVQNHYSYDAFGKRRFDDWFANPSDSLLYDLAIEPRRGFTGHEHLENVGLIHMNGRVYDPILGRFTSPDTYVQFPETTQGFNRYTYVNNNPLSYTDPSGHFIDPVTVAVIGAAIAATGEVLDEPLLTQVGFAIIGAATPGFYASVGVGFGSGFAASGGNLKAGLYSAATAAAFAGVHAGFELPGVTDVLGGQGSAGYYAAKAVVHGVVGGASSDLQGGSFTDAFIGAAASQFATAKFNAEFKNTSPAGEVIIAATIGGTAAELSGGKFANGAVSAAFAKAFNDIAFASGDPKYTEYKIVNGEMVRQDLNGRCATVECAMWAGSMNHEGAATKHHNKQTLDQTLFRVQVASTPFAVLAPFTVAGRVAGGVLLGVDGIKIAADPGVSTICPATVSNGVAIGAKASGFGAAAQGVGIGAGIVTGILQNER